MMGQNRSGMRISSVSSAGYVSANGRQGGIMRGIGCPALPSRNSTTFFMFLISFATNIYFYIENQELLHNLAYKEIHETLKIEECRKLMAIQDKKFHEELLKNQNLKGRMINIPQAESFNSDFDEPPRQVKKMPNPLHPYVKNPVVNRAPGLVSDDERFDNHLKEPSEDFRDDFPSRDSYGDTENDNFDDYGDQRDTSNSYDRSYPPQPPKIEPIVPVAPVAPAVPESYNPPQPAVTAAPLKNDQLDEIEREIQDSKTQLQLILDRINDKGVEVLASQLVQDGNEDIAEIVQEFESQETPDEPLDLNFQEISEIKSDVEEIINENPQYEAEPDAAAALDDGFNAIELPDSEPADNFGLDGGFGQEPPVEAPYEPEIEAPEAEAFPIDTSESQIPNSDVYNSNSDAYGENSDSDSYSQNSDAYGSDTNDVYGDQSEEQDLGFEENQEGDTEISNINDAESLNLERPIGEQELQSQRAENLPTGEILNQTPDQNSDSFLPQMPVRGESDEIVSDPFAPVHADIANPNSGISFGGGGRLDQNEDPEPVYNSMYGQNYANNYGQMYGMGNVRGQMRPNQFGAFPANNQFQRLGMNGHGVNPQLNQNNKAKDDPDERRPVQRKTLPSLRAGELAQDCNQLYNYGVTQSAVYNISPNGWNTVKARCDFTNSGGWTVFQYRHDGSVDFFRNYEEYTNGFGDPKSEYWIGLEAIHQLTMNTDGSPKDVRLRVEVTDASKNSDFVEHDDFYIYGAGDGYKANIGPQRHPSDMYDAFSNIKGEKFTTYDKDQDTWSKGNCANDLHSGGWFSRCTYFNFNGRYYHNGIDYDHAQEGRDGIYWHRYDVNKRPIIQGKRLSAYQWSMVSTKISILVEPNS